MPKSKPDREVSLESTNSKTKEDFDKLEKEFNIKNSHLCLQCRGTKMLCGKKRCPILAKFYNQVDSKKLNSENLEGSSPPSVFVGRYGYPKVNIGPLVPPQKGDTSLLGTPERWFGKDIDSIVKFRSSLVRGKKKAKVKEVNKFSGSLEETRYLALAKKPAETEVSFKKKPLESMYLDGESQPYGPSGTMKQMRLGSMKAHPQLDKYFYQGDLKAEKGALKLYRKDVPVSKIQDIFMVGGLGIQENRKLVPTRWSITAVDDIIGKDLRSQVKQYRRMDHYEIYEINYLDNKWIILMMPTNWKYELIEAWYPGTTWNPTGENITIFGSSEGFEGRKEYAQIGGCYYAARLAVGEKLKKKKRQAGILIMRESHPGYILPVGVWNVRETVRKALEKESRNFETLRDSIKFCSKKLDIPMNEWIQTSEVLRNRSFQTRLRDFQREV